jgi:hypothetical protein
VYGATPETLFCSLRFGLCILAYLLCKQLYLLRRSLPHTSRNEDLLVVSGGLPQAGLVGPSSPWFLHMNPLMGALLPLRLRATVAYEAADMQARHGIADAGTRKG